MTILKQAHRLICNEYARIWEEWYKTVDLSQAKLVIEKKCESSGYKKDEDTIYLFFPEVNLEEILTDEQCICDYTVNILGWNLWRRELVHEMLHEYQYKIILNNISIEGRNLYKQFGQYFSGAGHGPDFFTAISIQAKYFSLTPETLIHNL